MGQYTEPPQFPNLALLDIPLDTNPLSLFTVPVGFGQVYAQGMGEIGLRVGVGGAFEPPKGEAGGIWERGPRDRPVPEASLNL